MWKDEIAEDGGAKNEAAVNIPLGQLIGKARQSGLDDHNGKTICTYCNGGYRGNIRAYELNKKGLEVWPLMAGMQFGMRRKRRIRNDLYL
jgi:rhodanese-related sulfurtransferase